MAEAKKSAASGLGMQPLPSGMVAFLFTDIEGSTERWERYGDAMDAAVKRHDGLLRAAIEDHNGYVFKTVGDAFCAAFTRVSDAVIAAIDAQRALACEDFSAVDGLRVRAGLHVGEASERDNDYFGPAVNRVARLMSIGHGGQVVLSSLARDHVYSHLPTGAALTDLGLQRLKDLAEPERVWQLTVKGLQADFPPLTSLDAQPNNLPIQPTSFRGREHDLQEAKTLLGQHSLLTIVGAGGVGKTRLAMQVAADLLGQYPDGVWLADLAPITDPELISSVIARALGMAQVEGLRFDAAIPQWLRRKKLLLVLDNCEHVLQVAAQLADAIIRSCPDVRLLTTSRQGLGIGGEAVYRLPSLAIPDISADLQAPVALRYGAVALFVDRARAADTRFALNNDNAPIVADICRRLDGIPLAIELAASRVKVLSISNLAQHLDDRFKILTGGSRAALPRQKTLSALIDWSYDLLTLQEQAMFTRVGIFAGGFSLDAAAAVCAGDGIEEIDILDLVSSLTDKSLVAADTSGERERYRLLESTRAYALEKLAAGGERERLARRHAEYFRDQSQAAEARYRSRSLAVWLTNVEFEIDNYRAALEWTLTGRRDVALGGAIAGALRPLWTTGGLSVEGRYWIEHAQAGLSESAYPQVAARLWYAFGLLSDGKRKHDCAESALALYQTLGDIHGTAWSLLSLALSLFQMGRVDESSESYARALAAMRDCGDMRGVASCLNQQATFQMNRGDVAAARDLYAQTLEAYNALEDGFGKAAVLGNLAELEFADGRVEQALRVVSEAVEILARGKNATLLATGYNNIAAYRIALGDEQGARVSAREGLRCARDAQYSAGATTALLHFALLGSSCGQARDSARLIGYVDEQYENLGMHRESTEKWSYERLIAALHEQLSGIEIEKLAVEGAAWSEDQAIQQAMTM
jgi:predicted ATPase/class 3 adenylate cyclase